MNKAFTQSQIDHLLEFIGYGRLKADIWSLVMQENGGDEENLRARLKYEEVEKILSKAQQVHGISQTQRDWRGMSEIMLRLEDKTPDEAMLRPDERTAGPEAWRHTGVLAVPPILAAEGAGWGYSTLLPEFENQAAVT